MIDAGQDEQILDQFRKWLHETRQESLAHESLAREPQGADDEERPVASAPGFGLGRLVEEFTALRHELKLQTRSSRSLEERVEASLTLLAEATEAFQSAAIEAAEFQAAASQTAVSQPTGAADKAFALTLAELDEALDRGREQWEKNSARLAAPSAAALLEQVDEIFAGQGWWRRKRLAGIQRRVCEAIEQADEQARRERQAVLTALLSGYALLQQRVARAMLNAGVMRIPTVGQLVDPEQMVVVEVVDAAGPSGQVVEEIRRGYTWQGGLLRTAEVRAIRPRFEQE